MPAANPVWIALMLSVVAIAGPQLSATTAASPQLPDHADYHRCNHDIPTALIPATPPKRPATFTATLQSSDGTVLEQWNITPPPRHEPRRIVVKFPPGTPTATMHDAIEVVFRDAQSRGLYVESYGSGYKKSSDIGYEITYDIVVCDPRRLH